MLAPVVLLQLGEGLDERGRSSNIENDSFFVDALFDKKLNQYVAAMSYWQSLNFSWTAAQDFEAHPFANSSFNFGLKYEQKNLKRPTTSSAKRLIRWRPGATSRSG